MIAYEVAQQLQRNGDEISLLTMMDTPTIEKIPSALDDNIDILIYLINLSEETRPDWVEELKLLNESKQLEMFLEHAKLASHLLPDTSVEQLGHYLQMFKADQEAMYGYKTEPYNGDVLYFRAALRDKFNPPNPESNWQLSVKEDFKLLDVSGNHLTMMQKPHVQAIGQRLKQEIGKI